MSKNRYITAGIAALLLFLVLLTASLRQHRSNSLRDRASDRQVVFARRTIPAHKVITQEMIYQEPESFVAGDIPKDALSAPTEAIGNVSWTEIYPGKPILQGQLRDKGVMGAAAKLASGKRAMSITVTEGTAVAGLIRPLDRVDVLGTFNQASGGTGVTTTLLQNVEVLAVGKSLDEQTLNATNGSNLVTLSLTPQEARWLASAVSRASLQLVLHPLDGEAEIQETALPPSSYPSRALSGRPAVAIRRSKPPVRKAQSPRPPRPERVILPPASPSPVVEPLHPPGGIPDPVMSKVASQLAPANPALPTSRSVDVIVGTRRASVSVPIAEPLAGAPSPRRAPATP